MKSHYFEIMNSQASLAGPTRREALAALAVALPACVHQAYFSATAVERGQVLVPRAELSQLGGPADVLFVRAAGAPGAIAVRLGSSGRYTAVLALCTHRGCEVAAQPQGYLCPCHGSRFDLAGEVVEGPAERPLLPLPVQASADGIAIVLAEGRP